MSQPSTPATSQPAVITTALHGDVLVVTIDHPPVNALSADARRGLLAVAQSLPHRMDCAAVLLVGAGRAFIGGSDVREFGKLRPPPSLPEVCDAIEASPVPVIAAIHGACLGGGLEVALAAHYRLADESAKLGLPEVTLGLLPGSGGTQRGTRLAGAQAVLDLALSGRHVGPQEAASLGLVDRIVPAGNVQAAGLTYAAELIAQGAGPRRSRDATAGLADAAGNRAAVDAARTDTARKSRGLFSPLKIVDAVEAALTLPFDEGMAVERAAFLAALESPQRAGLVHVFFAEREVAKAPELSGVAPRSVNSVGVVGGGTMGAGIAVALLDAGYPVTMIERDEASLSRGRANVEKVYDGLIAKGRLTADGKARVLSRFTGATQYEALAQADLVIEAVFEDMTVKQQVLAELSRVCKPGAVLATNTSYLDINALAAGTPRPQDVVGLHFFSPANIMKLLEIVVPERVAPDAVATGFELARRLKKVPVRAGVCDGFIGNRILATYRQAADYLLADGASPYQIDQALRDFGLAMGPFQVIDLAGGDIGWATRKRRASTRDARLRYVAIADRLCERGWFGQKTGRGWYLYPQGARIGQPDPEVLALVDDERAQAGITPRAFSDDEIVRRVMAAMVNEGCKILADKIALRPLDIDVVMVYGYGFPRHRGGPMFHADQVGLHNILADLRAFGRGPDGFFWEPAPLLESLVSEGRRFADLNTLGDA